MTYLVAFPVALLSSLALTPVVRRLALRLSFADVPDGKRFHNSTVPLLGGVAVVSSVLLAWVISHFASGLVVGVPELLLILGFVAAFGLGLYDDRKGMSAKLKLACQALCAVLLVSACYAGGWMRGDFLYPLLVVWVVAIMNAANFMDNMDGVASGVTAVASLAFTVLLSMEQHWVGAILAASLFGASLGFLRYNFSPASIFLGDAGSLPMGYLLAALSILAAGRASFHSLAVPVVVLGYPVFDITFVTLVRIKENRKVYQGGRDHSSHRLAACCSSTRKTVGVIYLICLALGATGFLMKRVGEPAFSLASVVMLALLLLVLGLRLDKVKSHLAS